MKKPILLIAVIAMTAINLFAQNDKAINDRISQRFNEEFPGAKNLSWTSMPNKISNAHFYHSGHVWMAIFDGKGQMVATGRKVKNNESLPLQISEGLQRQKTRLEKKYGDLAIAHTYEMVADQTTKYYSTLGNSKVTIVVSSTPNGYCIVERKDRKHEVQQTPAPPRDVIAKKN